MTAKAFPLQWPDTWNRTDAFKRARAKYKVLPGRAQTELLRSLKLLGAQSPIVVSSNIPLRRDGLPYADSSSPQDPGVAVYWQTPDRGEKVIACDKWTEVFANIRAIGLAVDGMRAIDRAGASQILERMFTAFAALPGRVEQRIVRPWWEVFGLSEATLVSLSGAMVEARYRELAMKLHPDRGGDPLLFKELSEARDQAKAHYGTVP